MNQRYFYVVVGALAILSVAVCRAQDYDDEGYGNQGGNNQGDSDSYGGNDDGYSNNSPNQYQNVDSDGSNNQANSYSPASSSSGDSDGDYEGDDASAAASEIHQVRVRRSTTTGEDDSKASDLKVSATLPKKRVKRHGKYYIGPVYTYVKTDKHANFKWGVKHKVGKKHYG